MYSSILLVFSLLSMGVALKVPGYTYYPEVNKWYKYVDINTSWVAASRSCRDEGARLAMPRNSSEANIIVALMKNHSTAFSLLGFHDAFMEGSFITETGETLETFYNKWAGGEPNSGRNENCGSIHESGGINDTPCDLPLIPYTCEMGPRDLFIREPAHFLSSDSEYIFNSAVGKHYKYHKQALVWEGAVAACRRENAELAMPENAAEAEALKNIFNGYPEVLLAGLQFPNFILLGFHDGFVENQFEDLRGYPQDRKYNKWGPNEPKLDKSRNCVALHRTMLLHDFLCHVPATFICQKSGPIYENGPIHENSPKSPCNSVDADYAYYPEVGVYYKVVEDPKPWMEASKACRQEGGSLAVPADNKQAEVLRHVLALYPAHSLTGSLYKDYAWLGIHDRVVEGKFVTEEGETILNKYHTWAEGELNGGLEENCGMIHRAGGLGDLNCETPLIFICQKTTLFTAEIQVANSTAEYETETSPKCKSVFYDKSLNRRYSFYLTPQTWIKANTICMEEHSLLAVINSVAEAETLMNALSLFSEDTEAGAFNKSAILVGITDLVFNGLFSSNEGILVEQLGYNLWAKGDSDKSLHCGGMLPNGHLVAVSCDEPRIFFCERRIKPNTPTVQEELPKVL